MDLPKEVLALRFSAIKSWCVSTDKLVKMWDENGIAFIQGDSAGGSKLIKQTLAIFRLCNKIAETTGIKKTNVKAKKTITVSKLSVFHYTCALRP